MGWDTRSGIVVAAAPSWCPTAPLTPCPPPLKPTPQSKGGILSKACDYIQELRQSNHRLSEELQGLDQLQMDNEVLRQQVGAGGGWGSVLGSERDPTASPPPTVSGGGAEEQEPDPPGAAPPARRGDRHQEREPLTLGTGTPPHTPSSLSPHPAPG